MLPPEPYAFLSKEGAPRMLVAALDQTPQL